MRLPQNSSQYQSRCSHIFKNCVFPRIPSFKTKICPKNRQKIIKKKFAGLRPAHSPYGAAPLPSTKVGAKCLTAVVLDNPEMQFANQNWYKSQNYADSS